MMVILETHGTTIFVPDTNGKTDKFQTKNKHISTTLNLFKNLVKFQQSSVVHPRQVWFFLTIA